MASEAAKKFLDRLIEVYEENAEHDSEVTDFLVNEIRLAMAPAMAMPSAEENPYRLYVRNVHFSKIHAIKGVRAVRSKLGIDSGLKLCKELVETASAFAHIDCPVQAHELVKIFDRNARRESFPDRSPTAEIR